MVSVSAKGKKDDAKHCNRMCMACNITNIDSNAVGDNILVDQSANHVPPPKKKKVNGQHAVYYVIVFCFVVLFVCHCIIFRISFAFFANFAIFANILLLFLLCYLANFANNWRLWHGKIPQTVDRSLCRDKLTFFLDQ